MPLPVIHSFAGYSVYKLSTKSNSDQSWKLLVLSIFLANLADFDFVPGVLLGKATLFHRGLTHSLVAPFLVGLAFGAGTFLLKKTSFFKAFLASFVAYGSHVLLDFFTNYGVPLLWPFSSTKFHSPICLFIDGDASIHKVSSFKEFFLWFLSPHAIHVLCFEMTIVFSIWALTAFLYGFKEKARLQRTLIWKRSVLAAAFFIGFIVT